MRQMRVARSFVYQIRAVHDDVTVAKIQRMRRSNAFKRAQWIRSRKGQRALRLRRLRRTDATRGKYSQTGPLVQEVERHSRTVASASTRTVCAGLGPPASLLAAHNALGQPVLYRIHLLLSAFVFSTVTLTPVSPAHPSLYLIN